MSIKEIRPTDLTDNVFKLIGQDWMLVSAVHDGKTNGMTASWGGLGILWARPVAYIFIRPTRYTKEFVDASDGMTLSIFEQKYKPMMQYFGTVSGRNEDKIAKQGLTLKQHGAYTYFEEARLTLLTKNSMRSRWISPSSHMPLSMNERISQIPTIRNMTITQCILRRSRMS